MCSRADVSLEILQTPAPVIVELDAMLYEQALINIIKNSIEAITPGSNGKITIETHSSPEKSLTVTDNGSGISDEAASHLFTPFYSTKPDGQGLGLIFISDVLTQHGCRFNIQTSGSDGLTRFGIIFR